MSRLKEWAKELIIWPQQYLRTDMLYIAKGGFWMTFGQVVGIITSAVLAIAYANLLPKESYGLYKYILSLMGIFGIFMLNGFPTAITQAVARGSDTILKSVIKYQLRWNSLCVIITAGAGIYYWLRNNQTIAITLLILAATAPLIKSLNSFSSYLTGKRDFSFNTIIDMVSGIFVTGIIILTIYLTDNTITLIAVYGTVNLVAGGVGYWLTTKKYPQSTHGQIDEKTASYGKSLSLLGAFGAFAQQLDKILVFKFAGTIELATYVLASAMPDRMKGFTKSIVSLAFPKLSAKNTEDIRTSFNLRIIQSFLFGALIASIYILIAPSLFKIFFPKYLPAIFYSQIMSLWLVFFVPLHYIGYAILSQKFTKSIYILESFTVITRLACYIGLGLLWGVIGIVISRVLSIFLIFLAHLVCWSIESKKLWWAKGRLD